MKYPIPFHESIEETHRHYNSAIAFLLGQIDRSSVVIATHNEESVKLAFAEMKKRQLPFNHEHVHFAQLYGMSDHLSLAEVQAGIRVCKYVAFGPVHHVMPYLIRRMQENRGFVARTVRERELLRKEIVRRFRNKMPVTQNP